MDAQGYAEEDHPECHEDEGKSGAESERAGDVERSAASDHLIQERGAEHEPVSDATFFLRQDPHGQSIDRDILGRCEDIVNDDEYGQKPDIVGDIEEDDRSKGKDHQRLGDEDLGPFRTEPLRLDQVDERSPGPFESPGRINPRLTRLVTKNECNQFIANKI
jgi:hypothetical protein